MGNLQRRFASRLSFAGIFRDKIDCGITNFHNKAKQHLEIAGFTKIAVQERLFVGNSISC